MISSCTTLNLYMACSVLSLTSSLAIQYHKDNTEVQIKFILPFLITNSITWQRQQKRTAFRSPSKPTWNDRNTHLTQERFTTRQRPVFYPLYQFELRRRCRPVSQILKTNYRHKTCTSVYIVYNRHVLSSTQTRALLDVTSSTAGGGTAVTALQRSKTPPASVASFSLETNISVSETDISTSDSAPESRDSSL